VMGADSLMTVALEISMVKSPRRQYT